MKIIFTDGSVLECNEIEFSGCEIIVDGYRIVSIGEIEKIIS